jgi:hypothetical protein
MTTEFIFSARMRFLSSFLDKHKISFELDVFYLGSGAPDLGV